MRHYLPLVPNTQMAKAKIWYTKFVFGSVYNAVSKQLKYDRISVNTVWKSLRLQDATSEDWFPVSPLLRPHSVDDVPGYGGRVVAAKYHPDPGRTTASGRQPGQ